MEDYGKKSLEELLLIKEGGTHAGKNLTALNQAIVKAKSKEEVRRKRLADVHAGWEKFLDAKSNLLRLIIFGNGGGLIATLTFISTFMNRPPHGLFDRAVWWVLIFFVLGLTSGGFARFAEMMEEKAGFNLPKLDEEKWQNTYDNKIKYWSKTSSIAVVCCSIFLIVGVVWGLSILWTFTQPERLDAGQSSAVMGNNGNIRFESPVRLPENRNRILRTRMRQANPN